MYSEPSCLSVRVFCHPKEFEVVVEQNRRAIRLVRTFNFQFPILAHFLYAAEGVVEIVLRGGSNLFGPNEISSKLLVEICPFNKLRRREANHEKVCILPNSPRRTTKRPFVRWNFSIWMSKHSDASIPRPRLSPFPIL